MCCQRLSKYDVGMFWYSKEEEDDEDLVCEAVTCVSGLVWSSQWCAQMELLSQHDADELIACSSFIHCILYVQGH